MFSVMALSGAPADASAQAATLEELLVTGKGFELCPASRPRLSLTPSSLQSCPSSISTSIFKITAVRRPTCARRIPAKHD